MASGPITSWEIDGETVKTVSDFIFGGSKITADGDCSHDIKNLDSIFKSRDITLPIKVRLVKAMVFPVVMYGCDSWTMKKTERRLAGSTEKAVAALSSLRGDTAFLAAWRHGLPARFRGGA